MEFSPQECYQNPKINNIFSLQSSSALGGKKNDVVTILMLLFDCMVAAQLPLTFAVLWSSSPKI